MKPKMRRRVKAGIDFEWSKSLWTHNVFRVFELLFGAPIGIRASVTSFPDGKGGSLQYAHTFEAAIALMEVELRRRFKKLNPTTWFEGVRIYVPQMATSGLPLPSSPWIFAIAFDNFASSASGANVSSLTYTHVCTGSNLTLVALVVKGTNTAPTANTYNSVAMTAGPFIAGGLDSTGNSRNWSGVFYAASAPSGSHSVAYTIGTTTALNGASISLTGTNASPAGGSNTQRNTSNVTSSSTTVTTTGANSVIVDFLVLNEDWTTTTATGSGQTIRGHQNDTSFTGWGMGGSTMTTTTAGSYTPGYTFVSSISNELALEILAAATAVNSGFFLATAV
jgi:hypothetical protein